MTAGIDFGLRLLFELRGEEVAKLTQLVMEYDPEPQFETGHSNRAAPQLVKAERGIMGGASTRKSLEIAKSKRIAEPA